MLIFQIPPQTVRFRGASADLKFPSPAKIWVQLAPKAIFGEGELDGSYGIVGNTASFKMDLFSGAIWLTER
jgi:hypothetical protein